MNSSSIYTIFLSIKSASRDVRWVLRGQSNFLTMEVANTITDVRFINLKL